jgi:hypothetical protein
MIGLLHRYTRTFQDHRGKLILEGLTKGILSKLERTGLLELIGKQSIFMATHEYGMAANRPFEYVQKLLEAVEQQGKPVENES